MKILVYIKRVESLLNLIKKQKNKQKIDGFTFYSQINPTLIIKLLWHEKEKKNSKSKISLSYFILFYFFYQNILNLTTQNV